MSRLLPWLLAGLMMGGIAHISSILLMPMLSGLDATTKLRSLGPVNKMQMLAPGNIGENLIPFQDPGAVIGICPFDVSIHPLRIRVGSGDALLSLVFLQSGGSSFYALSDKAGAKGALDVRLATAEQLGRIEASDPEDQVIRELRVRAPNTTGIVLIRSISGSAADLGSATRRITGVTCSPEPIKP